MIYIVIDNSSYPDAKVLGVYRQRSDAEARWEKEFDETDPYGPNVEVVQWDIVNNIEASQPALEVVDA